MHGKVPFEDSPSLPQLERSGEIRGKGIRKERPISEKADPVDGGLPHDRLSKECVKGGSLYGTRESRSGLVW